MATEATTTTVVWTLTSSAPMFPLGLRRSGIYWSTIHAIGNRSILSTSMVGLVCSVKCPGSMVMKTFDAVRELRDAGIVIAGGFHSPMERECLDFLLRGKQPVVVCPAKGLGHYRIPSNWKKAIDEGRLVLVSPFADSVRRTTSTQAQTRNEFVASLAAAVLVPHASPGGKAEALAREILKADKPLFTFDDPENQTLIDLGAHPFSLAEICQATLCPERVAVISDQKSTCSPDCK